MNSMPLPLEDELGDVLEKALRRSGLTREALAAQARLAPQRIFDAIDYRSDLSCEELRRVAAVLGLNEVGMCALGTGRYPKPSLPELPFCVWPLPMPHGIGVANAYLVGECDGADAVLFDTGAGIAVLQAVWPAAVRKVAAVFLTHAETEHVGGLCDVVARFGVCAAYVPRGSRAPCGQGIGDGETKRVGALQIATFATPGHAAAHNCYFVSRVGVEAGPGLLIAGDLFFAGSVGGAYFSEKELQASLARVLRGVPPDTVVAPGHGPMTTVENELRFNPFVV